MCALFAACSSDDSATLKEWFDDQVIATSYGKEYQEIDVSFKDYNLGYDSSAYMVSSYAALGNVNDVEQMLYFGLKVADSLSPIWKLKPDSIFYANFYGGEVPEEHKKLEARFYWLKEEKTEHDSTWLKFQNGFKDSANISVDSFSISLPEEFLKLKADTIRLLTGIKLLTNNAVLRIAPPDTSNIPGVFRVAQKTHVGHCENLCLHAGVRESLNVVLKVDEIKTGKTVVFAQLILPKSSDTTGSELGHPMPVFVYNEEYKIDEDFVKVHGHPNLLFWESDTLKLQVTKKLRNYVKAAKLQDTIGFTLRLGNPMLNPTSLSFFNSNFSSRPAYASYDFYTALKGDKAKLRLWYAETD